MQSRVAARLKKEGSLTALDIQRTGITDARKIASRLRARGLIGKTVMEENGRGGRYARYYASAGTTEGLVW